MRKRKSSRRKAAFDEERAIDVLLGYFITPKFKDVGERRAFWKQNKDFLIDKTFTVGGIVTRAPGTRPLPWWQFDAPEHRRIVKGAEYWIIDDRDAWRNSKGCFARTRPRPGWKAAGMPPLVYETEAAYLKRLNLLLPGEAERIKGAQARET